MLIQYIILLIKATYYNWVHLAEVSMKSDISKKLLIKIDGENWVIRNNYDDRVKYLWRMIKSIPLWFAAEPVDRIWINVHNTCAGKSSKINFPENVLNKKL